MNKNAKFSIPVLLALPVMAIAAGALKSGPQVGRMVTAFEPNHVSGPDAGSKTCPVCKYGKTPAVQVWVNGDSRENVAKIADHLEASIKMEGSEKLKGIIVFIKPQKMSAAAMTNELKMVADKCKLSNVSLTFVDGEKSPFVKQYRINTSKSVKNTVIVYHDMKVDANFVNLKGDASGLSSLKGAMMKACGM